MYKAYAVSYDLRVKQKPDYKGLYEELKNSSVWWHYLESTWLIVTDETPGEVWNRLGRHIHQRDFLLIIEVRDNVHGWLPKGAWEWIRQYVPLPETALN
jgi:hypothetical protein